MELCSDQNDACKISSSLAAEILYLTLKRLKLPDCLKLSDIQALKFNLVTVVDLSVLGGSESNGRGLEQGEKYDVFSVILDVVKFCKYHLDGNEKYEIKSELKDELYCVLKMALTSLLSHNTENKNYCYQHLHELFASSISRLKQKQFIKEANIQSLHDIKQIGYVLDIIESVPSDKHQLFFDIIEPDLIILCQEVQMILYCADVLVTSHVMTYIFPVTVHLVNKTKFDVLSETWKTITSFFNSEPSGRVREEHNTIYLILCCLVEYCFPTDQTRSAAFPIHENDRFWRIIQHGLVHSSTIVRKRTMFVLKKVLFWCDTNSSQYTYNKQNSLFCWNSHDVKQKAIWEDITIVFETLEEKQVHVIKPLLSKVDDLIKKINGKSYFHPSWIMEIFHRMLNHESKFIVKWALFRILEFEFENYPHFIIHVEKFIPVLIKSLNDASLYSRSTSNSIGSCSSLGLAIKLFFHNCHTILFSTVRQAHYFSHILSCMHEQSWGGVALMNVSYALSELPPTPLWNETSIEKIKDLILNALRTQDVLLRGAVQCYLMKSFLNLIDAKNLTFQEFSKLLFILKRSESLCRGTQLWTDIAEWINRILNKNFTQEMTMNHAKEFFFTFLKNSLSFKASDGLPLPTIQPPNCNRMARVIILLADACNIYPEAEANQVLAKSDFQMNDVLQPVINILATAMNRPYVSHNDILFCLEFVSSLLAESKTTKSAMTISHTDGTGSRTDVRNIIKELLYPYLSSILTLVSEGIVKGFEQLQHTENVAVYLKAFEMLIDEEKISNIVPVVAPFIQQCSQIILSKQTIDIAVKQKCCWSYLTRIYHLMDHLKDELFLASVQKQNWELIEACINLNILEEQIIKPSIPNDKVSQKAWRCFLSNAEADQWRCIEYYSQTIPLKNECKKKLIYLTKQAMQSLDVGSHESVIPILLTLKNILPVISEEEELFAVSLQRAWKACNEFRKNELFKPAVETFIEMAYQPVIMASSVLSKYLNKYSSLLMEFTETSSYGFIFLIEHCCKIWKEHFCVFLHIDILCTALTFGPIYRKDQRIINDAAAFIASHGNFLSINQLIQPRSYLSSIAVRITAINFLRILSPSITEHQTLAHQLVLKLIDEDIHVSSTKSRHFGNSLIHRVKTRAWQSIFLLEGILSKENRKQLLKTIYCLLMEENHQPSVRYLLEWLAIKILLDCTELQDEFMDHFQNAAKKRIGSVVSFLSIVIHICTAGPLSKREEHFLKWIPLIIPWAMGQNFNTRIYAQLALMRFFSISSDFKFNQILNMYGPLFNGIRAVDNGNITKNTEKLSNSFYFSVFHPIDHCTLETIFYDLPRLSTVTDEEWIPSHLFETVAKNKILSDSLCAVISIFNADSKLRNSEASSWVLKTSDAISAEWVTQDGSEEMNSASNFQKKITPWKHVIPDLESLQEIGTTKKQWTADGLIVVASLIDRAPNLGGLCRTCEIFGVSEYVLGSLKYTEDKQFQNLCVSADKWVPLREVKPHCLKDYLLEMKQHGYTLIGVEQTDHSQSLRDFSFPQQSLLLLGNEKEGLPTDLIHLLDICVEIPQCGIIRSLNVHVSGAILIWEYARQHNFAITHL